MMESARLVATGSLRFRKKASYCSMSRRRLAPTLPSMRAAAFAACITRLGSMVVDLPTLTRAV